MHGVKSKLYHINPLSPNRIGQF